MFCPYCGKEISDSSSFCEYCSRDLRSVNPGASLVVSKAVKNEGMDTTEIPVGVKSRKHLVIIPVLIIAAILLITGAIMLVRNIFSGGTSDLCAWMSYSGYDFVRNVNKENSDPVHLDSVISSAGDVYYDSHYAQFTPDGKYLYYLNRFTDGEGGTLFRADMKKIKKSEDAERHIIQIASGVNYSYLKVFEDGTACYSKQDYSDYSQQLYYFDGKDSVSVGKSIDHIDYFEKEIIFSKKQDDDNYSIYYVKIDSKDEPVKIVTDAHWYQVKDLDHIIYSNSYNDENSTESLYMAGKKSEAVKIADNVYNYSTIDQRFESDFLYYMTIKDQKEISLGDVVTYDRYETDKAVREPDSSDPKYQIKDDSWWGYHTSDAYYDDYDAYEDAQYRLEKMEDLKEVPYQLRTYALYSYDLSSGKSKEIAGNVSNTLDSSTSGKVTAAAFFKGVSELNPVDISKYIDEYYGSDLEGYASAAVDRACINRDKIYFSINGGSEQELDVSSVGFTADNFSYISFVVFDSGSRAAFVEYAYNEDDTSAASDIYVSSIKGDKMGSFNTVDLPGNHSIGKGGDTLLGYDDNDTFMLVKKEFVPLAQSAEMGNSMWYEDGSVLILDNYQTDFGGTLNQFNAKGEKTKVADDVTYFRKLDSGDILYITNGNLKLYDGKNSQNVGMDVKMFWVPNAQEAIYNSMEEEYY